MKKLHIIILALSGMLVISNCNGNENGNQPGAEKQSIATDVSAKKNTIKRYMVKSGIVKYKTTIKGKMMGSTIDGSGTEELYFRDWGALELKKNDSKQVTHINIFGQKKTEVEETHTIDKLDNGKSYSVDTKNKIIYVKRDPAIEMVKNFGDGDVADVSKKMLESMGGKKVGNEKVMGYNCEVWEIPGGKQWIYKGIPLKFEMTMMGITTTTVATEAKFDVNVPDKYFELPDYPIQEMEGFQSDEAYEADQKEMKKNAQQMKKMTFEEYKKMVKQSDPETFKNTSEEELKMGYEMMKKMAEQISK
jgi:hypothetical protein